MMALGYVHAQDRLWQMELMRRIAPGRLSEIFGSVALKNDKFLQDWESKKPQQRPLLHWIKSQSYQLTMAYLDGINQYLDEGKTPIEFSLVGIKRSLLLRMSTIFWIHVF
jgi:penicillin amidase